MPSWIHQDNDKRNFFRTSRRDVFCKIGVLRSFVKFKILQNSFLIKETLAQRLSCEFCEISKNTFLHGTSLVAASVSLKLDFSLLQIYTLSLMGYGDEKETRNDYLTSFFKICKTFHLLVKFCDCLTTKTKTAWFAVP